MGKNHLTTADSPVSLESFLVSARTHPMPYFGKKKERAHAFETMQDLVNEALGDYPKDEEYHAVLLAQVGPVRYRQMIANARIIAALEPVFEKPVTGWNPDEEEESAPIADTTHHSMIQTGEMQSWVNDLLSDLVRMETDPVLYTWFMACEYLKSETFGYLHSGRLPTPDDCEHNRAELLPAILALAEYYRAEVYRETGNREALPPKI